MSRREGKKKKSKPYAFLKESKKRTRTNSNSQESPSTKTPKGSSPDIVKPESAEKLSTWKSLPRPSKISASHSQDNVSEDEMKKGTRIRRSLLVFFSTTIWLTVN